MPYHRNDRIRGREALPEDQCAEIFQTAISFCDNDLGPSILSSLEKLSEYASTKVGFEKLFATFLIEEEDICIEYEDTPGYYFTCCTEDFDYVIKVTEEGEVSASSKERSAGRHSFPTFLQQALPDKEKTIQLLDEICRQYEGGNLIDPRVEYVERGENIFR